MCEGRWAWEWGLLDLDPLHRLGEVIRELSVGLHTIQAGTKGSFSSFPHDNARRVGRTMD
jgi:hypothetical protein